MEKAYQRYKTAGVRFVGVIVQDTEADGRRFIREAGFTFPSGFDTDLTVTRAFRLVGMPLTIIIGRDGRIADRITGPMSEEDLLAKIQGLL
jgi:peroxiredoxin